MAKRKYKRLHYEDRQTIEAMSKQGSSVSDIAEVLGTHRDTIYREFKRCNATLKTYTAGGAEADKKRHVICISDGCLEEIGEYATKERCLEVLDEIQKACVSYLFTAGGAAVIRGGMDVQPFAAVIPRLYEMPEK